MLENIARSIRSNPNILEKIEISPIVQYIDGNSFKSSRIFSALGEDSAAIYEDDKYILITTDRIKTNFIENYPFGAGFSSILVSVDDIYACGGFPIAASIIMSVRSVDTCKIILEGICEASKKFKVPIIRGHTNPHGSCYELSSTMIGEINKNDYISARNAKVGDNIILAVDFNGKIAQANKLYYDTTTFKSSKDVLRTRKSMNIIAEKHLATASKDVSNGGLFGTLLQLIKYSNVGADVNLNNIIIPPVLKTSNYSLELYAQMYLTTAFILTTSDHNSEKMINVFKEYNIHASIIGKIINDRHLLKINDGKDSIDVIKF